jgi:hypothetical protein
MNVEIIDDEQFMWRLQARNNAGRSYICSVARSTDLSIFYGFTHMKGVYGWIA